MERTSEDVEKFVEMIKQPGEQSERDSQASTLGD